MQRSIRLHCVVLLLLLCLSSWAQGAELPNPLSDQEFWRIVTEFSESGGNFAQQYMSNEDSAQFVIPNLKASTKKGGVFLGVGSEQNFTYIAAIEPRLAFVIDIRRDNMLEHLMYKALFELSADRADFVSRLFARKRPAGLDAATGAKALFDAFHTAEVDPSLYDDTLRAVLSRLSGQHKFPLNDADIAGVTRTLSAFRTAGPDTLKGFGDSTNPTFAQLMDAADLAGTKQSFLASESNFKIVQDLEKRNLVIPLTGDFAGSKTLVAVGQYLKDHAAVVNVFYLSNVERYLFEQGDNAKRFFANVAALPLDASSLFVRAVTSDISKRLGIPIPESTAKWRTFLYSLPDSLQAFTSGKTQSYKQLFEGAK